MFVRGRSGMGKSALVSQFLSLPRRGRPPRAGEEPGYARAMSLQLSALLAATRGRRVDALHFADGAVTALERADLGYLAACARARRGALRGGMGGAAEWDSALVWLVAHGVRNPLKCLRMSVPDRGDARS